LFSFFLSHVTKVILRNSQVIFICIYLDWYSYVIYMGFYSCMYLLGLLFLYVSTWIFILLCIFMDCYIYMHLLELLHLYISTFIFIYTHFYLHGFISTCSFILICIYMDSYIDHNLLIVIIDYKDKKKQELRKSIMWQNTDGFM